MRIILLLSALMLAQPVVAAEPPPPPPAESSMAHSSVSVMVDPKLDDGRLVVRIAAKNLGTAPAPFGPASVSIAKPSGEAIALYTLQGLTDDVRLAAGLQAEAPSGTAPTQGAYAAASMTVRDGKVDPDGFTNGSVIGGDEYLRAHRPRTVKPTISKEQAQTQIAALKQAILQDSTLAPGQVTAGEIVSQKLVFKKGEDRTLLLRVRVAGDEHGFTIKAPAN